MTAADGLLKVGKTNGKEGKTKVATATTNSTVSTPLGEETSR